MFHVSRSISIIIHTHQYNDTHSLSCPLLHPSLSLSLSLIPHSLVMAVSYTPYEMVALISTLVSVACGLVAAMIYATMAYTAITTARALARSSSSSSTDTKPIVSSDFMESQQLDQQPSVQSMKRLRPPPTTSDALGECSGLLVNGSPDELDLGALMATDTISDMQLSSSSFEAVATVAADATGLDEIRLPLRRGITGFFVLSLVLAFFGLRFPIGVQPLTRFWRMAVIVQRTMIITVLAVPIWNLAIGGSFVHSGASSSSYLTLSMHVPLSLSCAPQ